MEQNYWSNGHVLRLSRRRALAATAATVFSAAFLAACNGSSNNGNGNRGSSGGNKAASDGSSGTAAAGAATAKSNPLLTTPADTSSSAKRGGALKSYHTAELQTFDPMFKSIPNQIPTNMAYARLFQTKAGLLQPSSGAIVPDLAASAESPETTQVTIKLKANAHFDPRPPTSGRLVDSSDVLYSWDRFVKTGTARTDYANSLNPTAPIVSVTAPDAQTAVFKLSEPNAGFLSLLANGVGGAFHIMPKEAEGGFDARRDQRGAGPWYLDQYVESSRLVYKRNPGYYDSALPYADSVELPIITEYAQMLAQFKTGALHVPGFFPGAIRAEDIIQLKKDVPALVMSQTPVAYYNTRFFYGSRPGSSTPFRDLRVRQAYAMSWDRDLFLDTVYNVSKFQSQGLPVQTAWSTAYPCSGYTGWWLDPKGKDFGPTAKYYQYDPKAAKQLLTAAGFANGLDVDANYVTTGEYGANFDKNIQIILGMARDVGIRAKINSVNFNTDWRPKYANARGDFDGISFIVDSGGPDPGEFFFSHYHHNGFLFMGFDKDGTGSFAGDPQMDDYCVRLRHEFDTAKRQAIGYELQRYDAQQQYYPLFPGGASGFALSWPAVQNYGVFQGDSRYYFYEWLDASKAPLKS